MAKGLTDKQIRAKAAAELASGKTDIRGVRVVNSVLRQSRRENAEYQRVHVHQDPGTLDSAQGAPSPKAAKRQRAKAPRTALEKINQAEARRLRMPAMQDDKPAELEARAEAETRTDASRAAERAADKTGDAPEATTTLDQGGAEWRSHDATADAENVATSAGDALPFTGKHFKQTEAEQRRAISGALERARVYDRLARDAFAVEYPHESDQLDAVVGRAWQKIKDDSGHVPDALKRGGDLGFRAALASYLTGATRAGPGRVRREAELLKIWQDWRVYRVRWELQNPNAHRNEWQPHDGPQRDPMRLPDAVAAALLHDVYGRQAVPAVIRAPDPLVAAWESDGMPLWGGELINLDGPTATLIPLERILRDIDAQWWRSELEQRVARNRATDDWWNQYRLHKPRKPSGGDDV